MENIVVSNEGVIKGLISSKALGSDELHQRILQELVNNQ